MPSSLAMSPAFIITVYAPPDRTLHYHRLPRSSNLRLPIPKSQSPYVEPSRSSGSSNMESGKAAAASASSAGGEATTTTTSPPVPEPVLAAGDDEVAAPAAGAGAGSELASAPPAPAASPKPYYECVFCKRGFTTAQALGGHMNIHRRDRAKPTTTTRDYSPLPSGAITTVSRNVECYNKYRHLLGSYTTTTTPAAAAQSSSSSIPIPIVSASSSFGMYYTTSSSSGDLPAVVAVGGSRLDAEGGNNPNSGMMSPRELSLFGDHQQDLHLGLGRAVHIVGGEGSRAPGEGSSSSERRQEVGEPPERELDLELRLGRCPSRH